MVEVFRTNDVVEFSFAEAVLKGEGIGYFGFDQNMSIMEGSIGVFPRRLMVEDADETRARSILQAAGLI
mgnify:CR=1 FL=1